MLASLGVALLLLCASLRALRPGECAGRGGAGVSVLLTQLERFLGPPGICLLFWAGTLPVEDRRILFGQGTSSFLLAR